MMAFSFIEQDGIKCVLILCPLCSGEGFIGRKKSEDDGEEYKDSFEKSEHGIKISLEVCGCCTGFCLVLVPLNKLTVLGKIETVDVPDSE